MNTKYLVTLFILLLVGFWIFTSVSALTRIDEAADFFVSLLKEYAESNNKAGMVLFTALAAISVLFGPFTSVFLVPPAILIWGPWLTFILLMIGWLIGGIGAYWIGRYVGHPLVSRILSKEKTNEWITFISNEATFLLAFLFRLALPAETGYVFGLVKYNFWKYVLIIFLAELPVGFLIVHAGDAFLNQNIWKFAASGASALTLFGVAGYIVQRRRRYALKRQ